MKIGKPLRTHQVEPLVSPVPAIAAGPRLLPDPPVRSTREKQLASGA